MAKKTNEVKVDIIKDVNDDTDTVKKFIFILVGVAIVTIGLYFLSSKYLIKDGVTPKTETKEETISYSNVLGGNVFNRKETDYYVLAFDPESKKSPHYERLLSAFDKKDSKLYFMDLSLEANKKYVKEESNAKPTKPEELAFKEAALIKIKNGKVDKFLEDISEIEKELK